MNPLSPHMARIVLSLALLLTLAVPALHAQPRNASPQVELKALLDDDLTASRRRFPTFAAIRGIPGYLKLLPDMSLAELDRERARERAVLGRLKRMDARALHGQERISYELLLDKMERAVERQQFPDADALVFSTLGGPQNMLPRAAELTPLRKEQDYRDYVTRIRATPRYVDQVIERSKLGMKSGWMSPRPVLDRVVAAIDAHMVSDADKSPLMVPFTRKIVGIPEQRIGAIAADARRAVMDDYQPALKRFREFIQAEYRPKAPELAGLGAYPGGDRYYEYLIRSNIIRGVSAKEIHEIGVAEIKRLRGEIGEIAKAVGFQGSTDQFIEHVRTDPKFFFDSDAEELAAFRAMQPRMDPQLPNLFHAVPRMPYAVRIMSPSEAASSKAANYQIGSLELGTPGYFTAAPHEAKWHLETLFIHELVPGHHMQGARAAEIKGLHPWRSQAVFNVAYGEGWALYAETLGYKLGFFTDPYQRYGNLQAQLFRAARLVVDTGIHAYGWPRDKAIAYMEGEGGCDKEFAVSEVDRYFSNPSQALGYMMGMRKMLELRARAEKALGPKFDLKDFHAVLIDNGSMPLGVLEKVVDEWIARGGGANNP